MKKRTLYLALAMLLLGCIPVLLFALFSYYSVTGPVRERERAYSGQNLMQNANAVERMLYNTSVAMDYFIKMGSLQEAMLMEMSGKDFQTYQQLSNELVRLQPYESMQANACLISIRQGWLINNNGLYRLWEAENGGRYREYIKAGAASAGYSFFPQDGGGNTAVYDTFFHDAAVHMVKSIPQGRTVDTTGMLMVKLPSSYLSQLLTTESSLGSMLVLDKDLRIIANSGASRAGESLAGADFIRRIMALEETSGTVEMESEDLGGIIAAYRHSDFNDWTYVLISSQSRLVPEFYRLTVTIVLLCGTSFLVLLTGSILASKKAYKPVSSIVERLSDRGDYESGADPFQYISASIGSLTQRQRALMAELSQQEQPIREYTAISLLQGTLTDEMLERRRPMMTGVHEDWLKVAVVLRPHPKLIEEDINSAGLLMTSLRQTVEEIMGANLAVTPVIINNALCVILTFPGDAQNGLHSLVKDCAQRLLGLLNQNDEALSAVGVGGAFTRLADASRSYRQALSTLSSSLFSSGEAILFYDDRTMTRVFRPQIYLDTQGKLLTAIKSADEAEAVRLLDKLFGDIFQEDMGSNEYIVPLLGLLTELIALRQEVSSDFAARLDSGRSIYDAFIGLTTREEMRNWLLDQMIRPYMGEVSRLHNAQQWQLVKRIREMIDTQFDKGITLESCASELNYHSGHIRKVFQQVTDMSFYDCLNQRRMNAAKEWLINTDMKIQEIAERLDYSNSQNFIRYFRAYMGETPGNFRRRKQGLDAPGNGDE